MWSRRSWGLVGVVNHGRVKESGTVHRWTELNRKEKPTLIKQSFQFHRWSYPNIWRWSMFYKFNFYSFHNFVLFASMKRRLQVFFLRTGLHFALLFTPIPQSNANKIYTLLRIVKTKLSYLTVGYTATRSRIWPTMHSPS